MLQELRSRPVVMMLVHTTVVLTLLTIAYYLLPFRFDRADAWNYARGAISLLSLVAVGFVLRAALRRGARLQADRYRKIQWLLSALYGLMLTFALIYAAIAYYQPDQFVGIEDRTDALYFSVTIVSTVGFGDIHAEGTAARLLVTSHMLFNLIYLGTALRLLTGTQVNPPGEEPP